MTNRGLKNYSKIKDTYDAEVKIKQSSAVGKFCWLRIIGGGINNNRGAAHLSPVQAKRIIEGLEKFLKDN